MYSPVHILNLVLNLVCRFELSLEETSVPLRHAYLISRPKIALRQYNIAPEMSGWQNVPLLIKGGSKFPKSDPPRRTPVARRFRDGWGGGALPRG
jgi:hypothetical protein